MTELLGRNKDDKFPTDVVLCELEGKTHGEAAERLGWPISTVSGRL
jgi:DNA-directed RNA polymerase specialized sigma24 family protein